MNKIIYALTASILMLASCKKKEKDVVVEVPSTVKHIKLQDQIISQFYYPQLDLDGDGVLDFSFGALNRINNDAVDTYFKILPTTSCQIAVFDFDDAYSLPSRKLLAASLDNASLKWKHIPSVLLVRRETATKTERMGWWNGSTNLYLGVRLKKTQDYYYGWLKMTHRVEGGHDRISITEMVIETVANKAIETY